MSSFGYKFLFFSFAFYGFIAMLLSMGAADYLTASIPSTTGTPDLAQTFAFIFINPFSAIGFLTWISFAIGFTDAYIIISSVT